MHTKNTNMHTHKQICGLEQLCSLAFNSAHYSMCTFQEMGLGAEKGSKLFFTYKIFFFSTVSYRIILTNLNQLKVMDAPTPVHKAVS